MKKRINEWIKSKIKSWLDMVEIEESIGSQASTQKSHSDAICDLQAGHVSNHFKIVETQKYLKVAVDIHTRPESENWAVICIAGKPEYVKFAKFKNNDIREVKRFLESFEYANIVCDAPPFMDIQL